MVIDVSMDFLRVIVVICPQFPAAIFQNSNSFFFVLLLLLLQTLAALIHPLINGLHDLVDLLICFFFVCFYLFEVFFSFLCLCHVFV